MSTHRRNLELSCVWSCVIIYGCILDLAPLQGQGGFVSPMGFRTMKEEMMSAECSVGAGPAAQKTESKKHPSLPKEVSCFFIRMLVSYRDFRSSLLDVVGNGGVRCLQSSGKFLFL